MNKAILFQDPAANFQLDLLKKVLDEKCPDAPKLDLNSVISESQRTAVALLRQKDVYAKGHTNSKEFDNMIAALDIVANWGKENPALQGMKNPPKSYEEALDQLKASHKVYREAKDGQKRPFPSKRRRMRLQFADIIDVFVDKEKENLKDVIADEKVVESWNQYFESRAETPILKEQNKAPVKDTKQMEEPVFTTKELEFVIR